MAVAGGATTAYRFKPRGEDKFEQVKMTYLSDLCDKLQDALEKFTSGEEVTVSGDNALKFRLELQSRGYVALPY